MIPSECLERDVKILPRFLAMCHNQNSGISL